MFKYLRCSSKRAGRKQRKRSNTTNNDDQPEQDPTNFFLRHPRPLIVILSVCTTLSILSMLDCHFVTVHIGFVPANVKIENTSLDAGVFSFQDFSYDGGKCKYNVDPYRALGFNKVFGRYQQIYDKIYVGRGDGSSKFTVPGDKKWTAVRVSSIISAASYAMTLSLALLTEISSHNFTVETISNLIFLASIFESFKFGCMFLIEMCVSAVWLDNTYIRTEGSYLKSAQSCEMGRSALMTVGVLVTSILTLFTTHHNKISRQQSSLINNGEGNNLRRSSSLFVKFFDFSNRLSSRQKSPPTTITLDMPLGDSETSLRSASHYSNHESSLTLEDQQPLKAEGKENDAIETTEKSQEKKSSSSQCKSNPSVDRNNEYQISEKTYENKQGKSTTLQSEPYHRVGQVPESCEYEMLDDFESESDESDHDYLNEITPLTGEDKHHEAETGYLFKENTGQVHDSSELHYASDSS